MHSWNPVETKWASISSLLKKEETQTVLRLWQFRHKQLIRLRTKKSLSCISWKSQLWYELKNQDDDKKRYHINYWQIIWLFQWLHFDKSSMTNPVSTQPWVILSQEKRGEGIIKGEAQYVDIHDIHDFLSTYFASLFIIPSPLFSLLRMTPGGVKTSLGLVILDLSKCNHWNSHCICQ